MGGLDCRELSSPQPFTEALLERLPIPTSSQTDTQAIARVAPTCARSGIDSEPQDTKGERTQAVQHAVFAGEHSLEYEPLVKTGSRRSANSYLLTSSKARRAMQSNRPIFKMIISELCVPTVE